MQTIVKQTYQHLFMDTCIIKRQKIVSKRPIHAT